MASASNLSIKQREIEALDKIFGCNGVYLFDYRGLKVSEFESLRKRFKEKEANVRVLKNRLAIKYFEQKKLTYGRDIFHGTLAVAYSREKFVEAAKILVEFEKESKKIKIMQGFIENRFVDDKTITEVAKLPGKEQLLAQFAFSIAAPLRKFGSALSSPLSVMLILMKNLKDKKEKGG